MFNFSKKSKSSNIMLIAAVLVSFLVVVFFYLKSTIFLGNVMIDGVNCSWKTADQALEILNANDFQSETIFYLNETDTNQKNLIKFNNQDFRKVSFSREKIKQEIVKANQNLLQPDNNLTVLDEVSIIMDFDIFKNLLNKQIEPIQSKDAKLMIVDGSFEVESEQYGNQYTEKDYKSMYDKICNLLKNKENTLKNMEYVENFEPIKPEITSEQLEKSVLDYEKQLDFSITIQIPGPDATITNPIDFVLLKDGKYPELKENKFVYDLSKINDFVEVLAEKKEYGGTVDFETTNKGPVEIKIPTIKWEVNEEKERNQLLLDLQSGKDIVRPAICNSEVLDNFTESVGNTYVEISKEEQHVWLYVDGKIKTEGSCVTGNVAKSNDTSNGLWYIFERKTNKYLVGPTWKAFVNYWMAFTPDKQGLHDASWRDEFGKDIYLTAGSHGCVNLPKELAKELYENTVLGTPVIVY